MHHLEQLALAGRFQFRLEFIGRIEMVFDGALVAARDKDHFRDACRHGFFHRVLDQRLVNDG
ncbi:hypothetical protein D3C72_1994770 [compost metagenome]